MEGNFETLVEGKFETFPDLSRFAQDVLSVPVSMVSSEVAFSSSRRILDDLRMSFTLDIVKILTIVRYWKQAKQRAQE